MKSKNGLRALYSTALNKNVSLDVRKAVLDCYIGSGVLLLSIS